jgi:hypothetical protein
MEQSPSWEANSSSLSQENSYLLWKKKFIFHKDLPFVMYYIDIFYNVYLVKLDAILSENSF